MKVFAHRLGTLPDRILCKLVAAGKGGITRPELIATCGSTPPCTKAAIHRLRTLGEMFAAGPCKLTRYYATKEWAEAASPVLWAQFNAESKERAIAYRERKLARDRNRYAVKGRSPQQRAQTEKARKKGTLATPWRLESPTKRNTVKPRDLPMVIPPHVRVQRLPHGEDRRYTVDPSHRGEFSLAGIGRYITEGAEA